MQGRRHSKGRGSSIPSPCDIPERVTANNILRGGESSSSSPDYPPSTWIKTSAGMSQRTTHGREDHSSRSLMTCLPRGRNLRNISQEMVLWGENRDGHRRPLTTRHPRGRNPLYRTKMECSSADDRSEDVLSQLVNLGQPMNTLHGESGAARLTCLFLPAFLPPFPSQLASGTLTGSATCAVNHDALVAEGWSDLGRSAWHAETIRLRRKHSPSSVPAEYAFQSQVYQTEETRTRFSAWQLLDVRVCSCEIIG